MRAILIAALTLLAGCDQVQHRMGFLDPAQVEADGKAVGGACRNAGRGLEDCFHLNPEASKSAVFAGWKEMSEYMTKNKLQIQIPTVPDASLTEAVPKAKKGDDEEADAVKPADAKKPTAKKKKTESDAGT